MVVFEGLIKFDARRMIYLFEDVDLVQKEFRVFDVLLCDFLNSSPFTSMFLLGLIDYAVGSLAKFLSTQRRCTFGLKS